jgi:hypothetical protein
MGEFDDFSVSWVKHLERAGHAPTSPTERKTPRWSAYRRMRRREVARRNTKYDDALSQFPGRTIVVRCDKCGIDYDARFVSNEAQHKWS